MSIKLYRLRVPKFAQTNHAKCMALRLRCWLDAVNPVVAESIISCHSSKRRGNDVKEEAVGDEKNSPEHSMIRAPKSTVFLCTMVTIMCSKEAGSNFVGTNVFRTDVEETKPAPNCFAGSIENAAHTP